MNEQTFQEYWNKLNARLFGGEETTFLPDVAYRGLPKDYDLLTTLQRLPLSVCREDNSPLVTEEDRANELARRERRLIGSFCKYGRELLKFGTTDWDVMLLGQHYRFPTRLLDWTLSPLVALFFASERVCDEKGKEHDGVIWCVSRTKTNKCLRGPLAEILKRAGTQQVDLEMLTEHFPRIDNFDKKNSPDALFWFEPPSVDQRIVNQFAYFSIMSGVMTRADHWLGKHRETFWKVPIPAHTKAEIRNRLYLLNVTDRTLFPGLEGVARWQKAYYSD